MLQIECHVGPEESQIGLDGPVYQPLAVLGILHDASLLLSLFFFDEIAQNIDFLHLFQKLGRTEFHRTQVDGKRAHDASASRLGHAPPVLHLARHQRVGRQGHNRVVEILYLHRVERHIDDDAVHTAARHHNPVAAANHVVLRQLHSRHKTQNTVFEDQHQHRGKGPQPGNQGHG